MLIQRSVELRLEVVRRRLGVRLGKLARFGKHLLQSATPRPHAPNAIAHAHGAGDTRMKTHTRARARHLKVGVDGLVAEGVAKALEALRNALDALFVEVAQRQAVRELAPLPHVVGRGEALAQLFDQVLYLQRAAALAGAVL